MPKYKVLVEGCEPTIARTQDAGVDCRAAEDYLIDPLGSEVVDLGLAIQLDEGTFAMLTHRSSMAFGKELTASLGIIDANYTGPIKAKFFNHSPSYAVRIEKGDKVAQLVIQKFERGELEEVEELADGKQGFGSSGVK